jgi:hypothetical protein
VKDENPPKKPLPPLWGKVGMGGIKFIFVIKGVWKVKIIYRLMWIGLLSLVLTGCAARDDIIILANRTSTLERNLFQLRDSNEETKTAFQETKSALSRRLEQSEKKIDSQLQPVLQNPAKKRSGRS